MAGTATKPTTSIMHRAVQTDARSASLRKHIYLSLSPAQASGLTYALRAPTTSPYAPFLPARRLGAPALAPVAASLCTASRSRFALISLASSTFWGCSYICGKQRP